MRTATTTWITLAALGLGGLVIAGCEQNEGMEENGVMEDTFGDGFMDGENQDAQEGTEGGTQQQQQQQQDGMQQPEGGMQQDGGAMNEENTGGGMQGGSQ